MRAFSVPVRLGAIVAVCILLASAPARAGERLALVIGNGAYRTIAPLGAPAADARLVGGALAEAGYDVTAVFDAELDGMISAVSGFADRVGRAGPDATAFVYFTGYGAQSGGRNFLAPVDADVLHPGDVEAGSAPLDLVVDLVAGAGAGLTAIVVDASRGHPFARAIDDIPPGLAPAAPPLGAVIAFSAEPGSLAPEGPGPVGAFAGAIAATLAEPGLDAAAFFAAVRRRVRRETGGVGAPWVTSAVTRTDLTLTPPAVESEGKGASTPRSGGSSAQ